MKLGRHRAAWFVSALVALLAIPLLVAIVVLRDPPWYPLLDMAQTELRVRDIWSGHPPLIGLAGRIGPFGPDGGSHPGPLSFYALWPFYELFGGSSWALQAANVVLDVIAVSLALWIAQRRGGRALALGVAAMLAVLMHAYGPFLLTLPWNPYLPVLWWIVFLLAVWSVVLDDLVLLPVAVFAGSFCMQTHIPYLGLVGGLVAGATAVVVLRGVRGRGDPELMRALRRYGLIALALAVVLWLPPVIDQFVHTPGNLTTIREHFSDPPESPVGLSEGVYVFLTQLNPWRLLTDTLVRDGRPRPVNGSMAPGGALAFVWAVTAVVAWRRLRRRALVALHAVLGVALALGVVSAARIFGDVWYYLLLWAWGLSALVVLAIGWTVVEFVGAHMDGDPRARARRAGLAVLAGVTIFASAAVTVDAADVTVQSPRVNDALGEVVGPTAAALDRMERDGRAGPYLVTWLPDPQAIGSQGFGLLNELLRRGYDVKAGIPFRPGATRFHVMDSEPATTEVHLATGATITQWRVDPRFEEIASFDPRSEEDRILFEQLRAGVVNDLDDAGLHSLVPEVDLNLWGLGNDKRVPAATRERITRMLALGMPVAVFIGSPSA